MKRLRITVEGKTYEVLVEMVDESVSVPARASSPVTTGTFPPAEPAEPKPGVPAGAGDILSPLAGKVVSINVAVGQSVDESTEVLTIEAMKMNTHIFATRAGRVIEILVKEGDGVEEGAALIRLE